MSHFPTFRSSPLIDFRLHHLYLLSFLLSSLTSGVQAEGDAGNTIRGHLAGGFHRRPGHRLLADQGPHVRWRLGGRAVPLQVRLRHVVRAMCCTLTFFFLAVLCVGIVLT